MNIKKLLKKMTAFALAGIVALGAGLEISAEKKDDLYESAFEYARSQMPLLMEPLCGETETARMSNLFTLYTTEKQESSPRFVLFALKDEHVIGTADISRTEDGYFTASFFLFEYPDVDRAIAEKKPMAFVSDVDSFYLVTADGVKLLSGEYGSTSDPAEIARRSEEFTLVRMESFPIPESAEKPSASFHSGWNSVGEKEYYVKKDGTLATGSITIGNVRYQFDKDGVCQGRYTGYTRSKKGRRYWKDGILVRNFWIQKNGKRKYYAGEDGYFLTGTQEIKGKTYRFDENGVLQAEGEKERKSEAEFLFTEDGLSFQIAANKAAIAYLRNDKKELSQYLADPNYDTRLSEDGEDRLDRLQYMVLKLRDPIESSGVYTAVYQILLKDGEMLVYLDIGLKKTDDGWKVESICLQG